VSVLRAGSLSGPPLRRYHDQYQNSDKRFPYCSLLVAWALRRPVCLLVRPTVSAFKGESSRLASWGEELAVTMRLKRSTSCTFSLSPAWKRYPMDVPCRSGSFATVMSTPANGSMTPKVYQLTVVAKGPGETSIPSRVRLVERRSAQ